MNRATGGDVTMFAVDEAADGGAVLTLHSRDAHGRMWRETYRLDLRVAVPFRQAVLARLVTAGTPAAQDAAAAATHTLLTALIDDARRDSAAG